MSVLIRPAAGNDALHVAAIVDIAGHGIDLESWIKSSGDDQAVLEAARTAASIDVNSPYHFQGLFGRTRGCHRRRNGRRNAFAER